MAAVHLRSLENGGKRSLRSLNKTSKSCMLTGKIECRLPLRRLRMRQQIEGLHYIGVEIHPDHATILYGSLLQMASFDVISRKCYHVADPQPRITHEQHHGAGSQPFVLGTADLVASGDDADDFGRGEGHHVVCFQQAWPLQSSTRKSMRVMAERARQLAERHQQALARADAHNKDRYRKKSAHF